MSKYLFLLHIFLLFSCMNNEREPLWKNPSSMEESVLVIPNDKATFEQKELKEKLTRLLFENVVVINNKLQLQVSDDYFEINGISTSYDTLLRKKLVEQNHWIEDMYRKDSIKIDVKETFERSKKEYFATMDSIRN